MADGLKTEAKKFKMFISSMARKNSEKQRELDVKNWKDRAKRRDENWNEDLIVTGEMPVITSEKGRGSIKSPRKHQRAFSAPPTHGSAPISSVELLPNRNASSHKEEIQLDHDRFDLALDLEDFEERLQERTIRADGNWFLNPIHRPGASSVPFSELVQEKPLTASVMKAAAEGTLARDYEEDISEISIDEFDMDLFKETDLAIYRNEIKQSLGMRSPFEVELAKLKREKLKLEEAYLLKLRCEAEVEETRGPKPRWYELKTKQFGREHRKYSHLLSQSNNWKDLIEYRNELIEASGRWANLRQ